MRRSHPGRYSGRTRATADGCDHCVVYADKIDLRAKNPDKHVPVRIVIKR